VALAALRHHLPPHYRRAHSALRTLETEFSAVGNGSAVNDEENDWVVVPGVDSPPPAIERSVDSPVTIATTVFGLILRSLQDPSFATPEFETYAPATFQQMMTGGLPWDPESLLRGPAQALSTSSRSGLWIFSSSDQTLILKRIRAVEKTKLLDIAAAYTDHSLTRPTSLLCPMYGCFRYTHAGRPLYFLLMPHSCPPDALVRELYDLKGSTSDRSVAPPPSDRLHNDSFGSTTSSVGPSVAMKDNDLRQPLELATEADWLRLHEALQCDSKFLQDNDLYDYSLLVAVADAPVGDAALSPPPTGRWTPWPLADGGCVYMSIIDSLTQWSVLTIGDSFAIPKARSLEYFVVKRFKPDGSLMPPALYQERFVRSVLRKFTFPGQPLPEPLSPGGDRNPSVPTTPVSLRRRLLTGLLSPTPGTPTNLARLSWSLSNPTSPRGSEDPLSPYPPP